MLLIISDNNSEIIVATDFATLHQHEFKVVSNYTAALEYAKNHHIDTVVCKLDISNKSQCEFLKGISQLPFYHENIVCAFEELYEMETSESIELRKIDDDLLDLIDQKRMRSNTEQAKETLINLKRQIAGTKVILTFSPNNKFNKNKATLHELTPDKLSFSIEKGPDNITTPIILRLIIQKKFKDFSFSGMLLDSKAFDCDKKEKDYFYLHFDDETKNEVKTILNFLKMPSENLNSLITGFEL